MTNQLPSKLMRMIPHARNDSYERQCQELMHLIERYRKAYRDLQLSFDTIHGNNIPTIDAHHVDQVQLLQAREERMHWELESMLLVHAKLPVSRSTRWVIKLCRWLRIPVPYEKEYLDVIRILKHVRSNLYHPRSN